MIPTDFPYHVTESSWSESESSWLTAPYFDSRGFKQTKAGLIAL